MNFDAGFIDYFLQASIVVKCVMVILLCSSIFSWAYILQRSFYLRSVRKSALSFEKEFLSGEELSRLYADGRNRRHSLQGLEALFQAGYKEYQQCRKCHLSPSTCIENTQRAMRSAQMQEQEKLENQLSFLAIVGSTSPYIGLFGTVWGIMQSFRALSNVQQATISMVAPGIAEALIATALGLFAAIPAVIAYNRFINEISRLLIRFESFQDHLANLFMRHTIQAKAHDVHSKQSLPPLTTQPSQHEGLLARERDHYPSLADEPLLSTDDL